MGGVVDFVGDVVGGVGDVVGGAVDIVGDVVGEVFDNPILGLAAGVALGPAGFGLYGTGAGAGALGGVAAGAGVSASSMGLIGPTLMGAAGATPAALAGYAAATGAGAGILGSAAAGGLTLGGLTSAATQALGYIPSSIASGLAAGEVGGIPASQSIFGQLKQVADVAKSGYDIYSALTASRGISPDVAKLQTDPYSPFRASAAQDLADLMKDPNRVYGMPGYKFAQEEGAKQLLRNRAALGGSQSGATLASLQKYGAETAQNWFNNYYNQLTQLSGAGQSPVAGANAYRTAAYDQSLAEKNRQEQLLQGVIGLGTSIGSFFG